jgi:hypothetical protein
MAMLHITDGSVASGLIEAAGIDGERLAWDDVLHEGPVPAGLALAELSTVRAEFIAGAGWDERATVEAKFAVRDSGLRALAPVAEEIVLWFEADLYDQVQLIQVLDLLAGEIATGAPVTLVEIDGHFGTRRAADMAGLLDGRRAVAEAQISAAQRAWAAFRAETPGGLVELLDGDIEALPFLRDAIWRHMEEFPSADNGLTRSEWQMLAGVAGKRPTVATLFKSCREAEERAFLGDTVFLWLLEPLTGGPEPLIVFKGAAADDLDRYPELVWRTPLEVTSAGKQVLSGRGDWMTMSGRELWRGGVRVNADNDWRHDPSSGTVRLKVRDHG